MLILKIILKFIYYQPGAQRAPICGHRPQALCRSQKKGPQGLEFLVIYTKHSCFFKLLPHLVPFAHIYGHGAQKHIQNLYIYFNLKWGQLKILKTLSQKITILDIILFTSSFKYSIYYLGDPQILLTKIQLRPWCPKTYIYIQLFVYLNFEW